MVLAIIFVLFSMFAGQVLTINQKEICSSTGPCGPGQQWVKNTNTCIPCETATYNPLDNHRCVTCFRCSAPDLQGHERIVTNCTLTEDTELSCDPGYYKFRWSVKEERRCVECKICPPGAKVIRSCSEKENTVCQNVQTLTNNSVDERSTAPIEPSSDKYNNTNNSSVEMNTNNGSVVTNINNDSFETNTNNDIVETNPNNGSVETNTNNDSVETNTNNDIVETNPNNGSVETNTNNGSVETDNFSINHSVSFTNESSGFSSGDIAVLVVGVVFIVALVVGVICRRKILARCRKKDNDVQIKEDREARTRMHNDTVTS